MTTQEIIEQLERGGNLMHNVSRIWVGNVIVYER